MVSVSYNPSAVQSLSQRIGTSAVERVQPAAKPEVRSERGVDNSAYWSISTTMRAENLSLTAVQDANSLAAAQVDTTASGLDQATDIVAQMQQKLIMAKAGGSNRAAIGSEVEALKAELVNVAAAGRFGGENWLEVEAGGMPKVASMLASVGSDNSGNLSLNMIDFDTAKSTLVSRAEAQDGLLTRPYVGTTMSGMNYNYFVLDAQSEVGNPSQSREIKVNERTTSEELEGMITTLNRVMIDMVGASAEVSATKGQISGDLDFLDAWQSPLDADVNRMVDSDMAELAVRRMAETAQAQLQSSGLNIGNTSMSQGLKYFL